MTPTRRYSPVEWCALVVATGVTALGATMIIAWTFELVGLLQLLNLGAPLRFNTAILFVLCGLMLACSVLGHRKTAEGIALAALLFALLCTARILNLVTLDVENLLLRPSEELIKRVGRGRMVLGTSLGALLFTLSILSQHRLRHGSLIALLLGIVICMATCVALNRYLMGAPAATGWPGASGMSLATAGGLFLLGVITIGLSCGPRRSPESAHWLPYSISLALVAVSFLIWRELVDNEARHLRRETAAAAAALRLQVRERLDDRRKAVDRFALRWGSLDRKKQRNDAERLLEDFDGILALYWISDGYRIGWICSEHDRQDFVGKQLPPGPRRNAVGKARETRRFVFTPVIQLFNDEAGFVGYSPTYGHDGEIIGCAAAVFRVGMILDAVAADRRHIGFDFSVSDANREVFTSAGAPPNDPSTAVRAKLALRGLDWQFNVWPTAQTVAANHSYAPTLAFAEGVLSALLVGAAIQLRQRAMQRTAEAERSAEALHSSEQRFDLAVRASKDGIWEWRLGTDGFYASPRYREILGYPQNDAALSYHMWFTRVHHDDMPRIERAINDHFRLGAPYDVVVRYLTFRDEWIWLRTRGQGAWNADGRPIRMAGSITDVTEEREAQRQLLQHVETIAESNRALAELAEAAEAAAEAKATFLRNMSHELRTPLNSIIGFSTGLLRHVAAHNLDDHQRDRIERIAASGRHLLGLVNNVLDIAKAEASDQSHHPEAFELPALLDEVTMMTEPLLQKKTAIKLAAQTAGDAPVPILDRAKLKQILLNLLSNAAKFTDRGAITLAVDFTLDGWRFAVTDTGIGIPADDQLRVFENFEQVRFPGRNVEGTGLGLSICAALAHVMGGQIALMSRPGLGSTFTLLVPQGTESNIAYVDADPPAPAFAAESLPQPT